MNDTLFESPEWQKRIAYVIALKQIPDLDLSYLLRLQEVVSKAIATKSSQVAQKNIFAVEKSEELSPVKTAAFHNAIRAIKGESDADVVRALLLQGGVDVNVEMSVARNLTPAAATGRTVSSPSIGIYPPPPDPLPLSPRDSIRVFPVYYVLDQSLLPTTAAALKPAYASIFEELLKNPKTDLNKKNQNRGECGGFGILHLLIYRKVPIKNMEAILDTKRIEINQQIDWMQGDFHGYTPLDLAKSLSTSSKAESDKRYLIDIYTLLSSRGAKHIKVLGSAQYSRRASQSDTESHLLNGIANGYRKGYH